MSSGSAERSVALVFVVLVLAGCLRRYPAPDEPAPTDTPYTALAVYLEISPPVRPDAPALPRAALRLAFASGGAVFADAALVDGPEHAAVTETWAGALALLSPRSEPIVLLASELSPERCELLTSLGERVRVAVRPTDASMYPIEKRAQAGEGSLDQLGGAELAEVCAEPENPPGE
jgi:hypothetical protein